jgi:hypothetical protein
MLERFSTPLRYSPNLPSGESLKHTEEASHPYYGPVGGSERRRERGREGRMKA